MGPPAMVPWPSPALRTVSVNRFAVCGREGACSGGRPQPKIARNATEQPSSRPKPPVCPPAAPPTAEVGDAELVGQACVKTNGFPISPVSSTLLEIDIRRRRTSVAEPGADRRRGPIAEDVHESLKRRRGLLAPRWRSAGVPRSLQGASAGPPI